MVTFLVVSVLLNMLAASVLVGKFIRYGTGERDTSGVTVTVYRDVDGMKLQVMGIDTAYLPAMIATYGDGGSLTMPLSDQLRIVFTPYTQMVKQ